jgi:hypothetical protein
MKSKKSNIFPASILIFGLCLLSSFAQSTQTSPESEMLIDGLVKQITSTMLAVAEAEKKAGNDIRNLYVEIDIPGTQSSNLGLVLDTDDKQGFRILSVTPGSLADSLNFKQGDLVTSINGVDTTFKAEPTAFAELENTLPGDTLRIGLNRQGALSVIEAIVTGQYTPPIKIELGSQSLNNASQNSTMTGRALTGGLADAGEQGNIDKLACGSVSVFFRPPITQRLYNAYIIKIGERSVLRNRSSFRLPPGKHTFYVHELIDDPLLTRRSRAPQRPKAIEIDIAANTTYYLAAKFNIDKRTQEKGGDYWDPIVWKVMDDRPCEL